MGQCESMPCVFEDEIRLCAFQRDDPIPISVDRKNRTRDIVDTRPTHDHAAEDSNLRRRIANGHFNEARLCITVEGSERTKGRHERRPSTKPGMKRPSLSTHRYDHGRRPGRKQLPRRINPATGRCRAISPASMPPKETPPTMSAGWMFRRSAIREAYCVSGSPCAGSV